MGDAHEVYSGQDLPMCNLSLRYQNIVKQRTDDEN